jgi:hypothetical protein
VDDKTAEKPDESGLLILDIAGNKWPAKLTLKEWRIAEKLLDKPLHRVLERMLPGNGVMGEFFVDEMATIFRGCIRGAGEKNPPTVDAIAQEIAERGQSKFIPAYIAIVWGALKGREEPATGEATASKG